MVACPHTDEELFPHIFPLNFVFEEGFLHELSLHEGTTPLVL